VGVVRRLVLLAPRRDRGFTKHLHNIFAKLDLGAAEDDHLRVRAWLRA
jgi:hypothetical protein